jgi:ferrochelatase
MYNDKGILLLNLGSPDAPEPKPVRRYLKEFLGDNRVLDTWAPIRWFVLNFLILPFRPHRSAEAYKKIWTSAGSPLMVTSKLQQKALKAALKEKFPNIKVELAMRYGSCSIPKAVERLKQSGVRDVFVMPFYPQYAMSSYETVVVRAVDEVALQMPEAKVRLLQPFYGEADYIEALYQSAKAYLSKPHDLLLFSFHGIPKRHLCQTDPSHAHCQKMANCCSVSHPAHATCYRHQCFETAKKLMKRAGISEDRYTVSFQSRLGREPWLKPYTDEVLQSLPEQGAKRLLVICPAFIADCLETLEEIEMSGKEMFIRAGGSTFDYIPCVNDHPAFIKFLTNQIENWL